MDLLGVVVLATVTAIGGGTIRDVLLDRHPLFWLADPAFLLTMTAAALGTVAYTKYRRPPEKALLVADAIGLAVFSISGARIAVSQGLPAIACIFLGTVTGSAGGVLRDMLCAEIPLVLQRGSFYATAALAGTALYAALQGLGVADPVSALTGVITIAGLRFASIAWGLTLPVYQLPDSSKASPPDRPA
jgi:uncharacterized membrane protein YeiH